MASPARSASRPGSPRRSRPRSPRHHHPQRIPRGGRARKRLPGMVLRSQLSVLLHAEKHAEPGARARARRALDACKCASRISDERRCLARFSRRGRRRRGRGGQASAARARSDYPSKRSRDTWRANRDISARRRSEEVASRRSSRASPATTTTTRARARTRPAVDRRPRGRRARAARSGPSSVRAGSAGRGPSARSRRTRRRTTRRRWQTRRAGGLASRWTDNGGAIGVSADGGFARVRRGGRRGRGDGRKYAGRRVVHARRAARRAGWFLGDEGARHVHLARVAASRRHRRDQSRRGDHHAQGRHARLRGRVRDEAPSDVSEQPGSPVFHPPAASFVRNRRARVSTTNCTTRNSHRQRDTTAARPQSRRCRRPPPRAPATVSFARTGLQPMPRSARSFSSLATRSSSVSKSARDTGAGGRRGDGSRAREDGRLPPRRRVCRRVRRLLALKFERAKRLRGLLCHPLVVLFLGGEILRRNRDFLGPRLRRRRRRLGRGGLVRGIERPRLPLGLRHLDLRHPGRYGCRHRALIRFRGGEVSRTSGPRLAQPPTTQTQPPTTRTRPPTTRTRPQTTRTRPPTTRTRPPAAIFAAASPAPWIPPRHYAPRRAAQARRGPTPRARWKRFRAGRAARRPAPAPTGTATTPRPRKFRC